MNFFFETTQPTSDPKSPKTSKDEVLDCKVLIVPNDWNDYGFKTLFDVYCIPLPDTKKLYVGQTRIMRRRQKPWDLLFKELSKPIPALDEDYCSLGLSVSFYKSLVDIGKNFAMQFLGSIRDVAYNTSIWDSFVGDECFESSLLREKAKAIEIRDAVPVLLGETQELIDVFSYTVKHTGARIEQTIHFDFSSREILPHRAILLVGTNGTGKTQLLASLAVALTGVTRETKEGKSDIDDKNDLHKRQQSGKLKPLPSIYQVIAVSFSAFDKFEIPKNQIRGDIGYVYIGLRTKEGEIVSMESMLENLCLALSRLNNEKRMQLSLSLKRVLGPSPMWSKITKKTDYDIKRVYAKLSAGQRIVLNILVHLLANLRKRSLLLLDEPETHLHPSLISALISEILHLLEENEAFSVIATHSPIIAQQITSDRILVLCRTDGLVESLTPSIECFGASLSEISNELFESREYERDYTAVLDRLMEAYDNDVDRIEKLFPLGLGGNARVYLRSIENKK